MCKFNLTEMATLPSWMLQGKADFDLDLLRIKLKSYCQQAGEKPETRLEQKCKLELICSHLYALSSEESR